MNHLERKKLQTKAHNIVKRIGYTVLYECPCNHSKKHKHHPDYTRPEEVHLLCPKCHKRIHIGDKRRPYIKRLSSKEPKTATMENQMNLKTYLETVENANQLAKRAGIAPSIIYRTLEGVDIKLSTAHKIIKASGNKIDYRLLVTEKDRSPHPPPADPDGEPYPDPPPPLRSSTVR